MIKSAAQPIKRIVTCQGSIQLVAAVSTLFYRQTQDPAIDENYLVIYDLYAPEGQINEFAAFIETMARQLCDWTAIVYLTPEVLQLIQGRLDFTSPSTLFEIVHQQIGTATADEIYLCRNWQFGNQLLINAYDSATKICYGDSIGLYFSATSALVAVAADSSQKSSSRSLSDRLAEIRFRVLCEAGKFRDRIRDELKLRTVLKSIPFDIGYFVLPDILGEVPPMPTVTLSRTVLLETFEKLTALTPPDYIAQFQSQVAEAPISVLLTSNLSEAGRMSQAQELTAYRQLLLSQPRMPNQILVVKPHPRDDLAKIQQLKNEVADLFAQVLILTEPELFFLPFEIFFLAAFPAKAAINVFAVSSACLSLKLLFDVPSFIGFGDPLSSALFDPRYVAARLEHEHSLRNALQKLETRNSIAESVVILSQS